MSELVWTRTADEKPPLGVSVLAVFLHQYANADWAWSWPAVVRREDCGYDSYGNHGEPYMWAFIELPPMPECADRDRAKRVGEIEAMRRSWHERVDKAMEEDIQRILGETQKVRA